ncbi:hypothetical protein C9I98_20555 [Photobacterium sanctipauli]|uniref:DUF2057 domain-containing protein n=1 Tax=Photobacterium sanctipauli TaxID=1342794 RepID=A0A2T3NN47_9GAMM|nr:hypothetical protein [Photobacterium sanctipauli]PSW16937.1 hypothetical protein C9I98_20555 [Photobacterium sanctipauli]
MKKLLLSLALFSVNSLSAYANELVTIDLSKAPTYQAIIELSRESQGYEQQKTVVVNMNEAASFRLSEQSAEPSTTHIEPSPGIPGKDYVVMLNTSIHFDSVPQVHLNQSRLQLSQRLPLSNSERIMIGGNHKVVSTHDGEANLTHEVVTEIWFSINKL